MKPTGSSSFKGRRGRSEGPLSEGLDKQLASYAAAASAADVGRRARGPEAAEVITRAAGAIGAGLLLSAGPASARIVYTPAYSVVHPRSGPGHLSLDLNHDGITDFRFSVYGSSPFALSTLKVSPTQAGNAILGNIQGVLSGSGEPFTCRVASVLAAGHRIGPGGRFGAYRTMFYFYGRPSPDGPGVHPTCGYWEKAQGRFLGLEFTAQGQKHFGWARLNTLLGGGSAQATLTGYAYETEPGKPIRAGDTGPVADGRVPEMHSAPVSAATLRSATLGLLALGSAGLDIWRKESEE